MRRRHFGNIIICTCKILIGNGSCASHCSILRATPSRKLHILFPCRDHTQQVILNVERIDGNMSDTSSQLPAVQHMRSHILTQLQTYRLRFFAGHMVPPLLVGVQGPQGSGKTFLTSRVREALTSPSDNLSVAVLSIDDLYLPHDGLVALATAHPQNLLLRGRGQPGTHDVLLGTDILKRLKQINDIEVHGVAQVRTPRFDKSLFDGEGDRVEEGALVRSPVDVVILEGWCVGFYPTLLEEIDRRWQQPVQGLGQDFFQKRGFREEDIVDVNERLQGYLSWWEMLDSFIQITPEESHPYTHIYKWRLQQEHNMKSSNGGKGMTDDQVEACVCCIPSGRHPSN
ncbi:hypothetical protein AcW1_003498 [Taiwanofungus camphoratus]|nr:hypothetical protein AcW1_003498 [Antrodia cinnamomea]